MSTIKKLHAQPKSIRAFARHLYECGELSVEEFIIDLARGRPFDETIADFARLNPKIVAALVAAAAEAGTC
jgi:hypothetical protein